MYYCEKMSGSNLDGLDAIDPVTGGFEVVGGIMSLIGQSKAADAAKKQQAAQLKQQRELIAAQVALANQQTQVDAGNTTLYIVGGILAVAVLGVVMASRSGQ
jgi:hypothetical protein